MTIEFGSIRVMHPIRKRGPIDVFAAHVDDRPCVLLRPNVHASLELARDALDLVAKAHASPPSQHFPSLVEASLSGEAPFVALASDSAIDFETIVAFLADTGEVLPHGAAIPMIDALLDAFTALHENAPDSSSFGALCYANVLLNPRGEVSIIGLGHNFPCLTHHGRPALVPGLSIAPELLAGGSPSKPSDVYALLSMIRSLLPYGDTQFALRDGMMGTTPSELTTRLEALQGRGLHFFRNRRDLDMKELRETMRNLRPLHGVQADLAAHEQSFCGLISDLIEQRQTDVSALEIWLSHDHRRVRVDDGPMIDLSRRTGLRRIFSRLVQARLENGPHLDWLDLLEAGWPGEKVGVESGRGRVHVAIYSLRKLGLDDVIIRQDDGYRLRHDARVKIDAS